MGVILVGLAVTLSRSAIAAAGIGMILMTLAAFLLSPNPRRSVSYLALAVVPSILLSAAILLPRGGGDFFAATVSTVNPASTPSTAPLSGSSGTAPLSGSSPSPSLGPSPTPVDPIAVQAGDTAPRNTDGSTLGHLNSLDAGWSLVKANPLGTGLGTVGPRPLPGTSDYPQNIIESYYLAMGVSLGWLGLLWTALLPLAMLATAVIAMRRGARLVGLCLGAVTISMAILSYVLPTMMEPQIAMIPWSICALAVSQSGVMSSGEATNVEA
jgi:hypothetical protein